MQYHRVQEVIVSDPNVLGNINTKTAHDAFVSSQSSVLF